MKKFAVLDADGWLLRFGNCPDHLIQAQAGDGETAVELAARPMVSAHRYRWIDGALVAVSPE